MLEGPLLMWREGELVSVSWTCELPKLLRGSVTKDSLPPRAQYLMDFRSVQLSKRPEHEQNRHEHTERLLKLHATILRQFLCKAPTFDYVHQV